MSAMIALTPFRIAVPDATLTAIRERIRAFPWDAMPFLEEHGDPWSAGASIPFMRDLCDDWLHRFDWRAQEAAINRFPQVIASVDGMPVSTRDIPTFVAQVAELAADE